MRKRIIYSSVILGIIILLTLGVDRITWLIWQGQIQGVAQKLTLLSSSVTSKGIDNSLSKRSFSFIIKGRAQDGMNSLAMYPCTALATLNYGPTPRIISYDLNRSIKVLYIPPKLVWAKWFWENMAQKEQCYELEIYFPTTIKSHEDAEKIKIKLYKVETPKGL